MIYERQKELSLSPPKSAAIIGVGGVGSWVAINLAMTGVRKLVLVDHDIVEEHNLNRCLFKRYYEGEYKVYAIQEIIAEIREDCEVIAINKKIEDLNAIEIEEINKCDEIIDCRDTIDEKIAESKIIGGYDGYNITLHLNPNMDSIFGDEEVTYSITPSFLVPPQIIAAMITLYLCCKELHTDKELISTFDVRDLFKNLFKK